MWLTSRVAQMSVRGRLFTTTLALIIMVELVSGVIFQGHLSTWLFNEGVARRKLSAEKIAGELTLRSLDFSDSTHQASLSRLSHVLEARISVIHIDGKLIYDSELTPAQLKSVELYHERPEVISALKSGLGSSRRHSITTNDDLIYVAIPIKTSQGKILGVIRLATPAVRLDEQIDHLNQVLWYIFAISLGLALLISGWAAHILSQTLRRLVMLARDLAEGEQSREVSFEGRDEYSKLARSLTMLASQIESHVSHLAESRDRFEAVLDAMREGVIALDAEHRVSFANVSACQLFNWSSPPLGQGIQACLDEESLSHFLREEAAEDEPWGELEFKGRKTVLARLTSQSIADEAVLVLSDITALRRLEAVRRDFVANVSHELRTPTTVIQANAETLIDGAIDDPEISLMFLEGIYRNSQRLARLVSDLLDLSRIESGTYRVQGEWVSPENVLSRVVDTLADQIIDKRIKVKIKLGAAYDKEYRIYTDADALEQVFTNLVENAVNYSDDGGKITVKANIKEVRHREVTREMIHFKVIDSGPGISKKHQQRIFERFYRVDKGRSRHLGGTGLGLAIVKHLCNAMDGEVGLESKEGEGCHFWFMLPVQPSDQDAMITGPSTSLELASS